MDIEALAEATDGYSGADLTNVCRDASMMSMRRMIKGKTADEIRQLRRDQIDKPVTRVDFDEAISNVRGSVGKTDLAKYEKWMQEFGAS